ncbi:MAG: ATP-binding cassette domain-containing protein [Oscillospiraceae bacterium]
MLSANDDEIKSQKSPDRTACQILKAWLNRRYKNQNKEGKVNAVEIRNLSKSFRGMYAVDHLNMFVQIGAIYGFIGENGSGKSTTEKIICGLIRKSSGSIKLFGREHTNPDVIAKIGVLIEAPGCFPNMSVWNNAGRRSIGTFF